MLELHAISALMAIGGAQLESCLRMRNLRHHSLIAWQRADDLFIKVHQLTTEQSPPFERYELASQLRKAAYSVPANIVEGYARRYRRMRLHVLNISEGSLAEVGYCLHVAHRLGYIDAMTLAEFERDLTAVGAPLVGLIRSARQSTAMLSTGMILFAAVLVRLLV